MKRLFMLFMMAISSTIWAREPISLVYSWTAGDKAANYYRALVDEANRSQTRYNFIFETRPGAGGTVAANHVLTAPNNLLWINSSAGFIRPNLYPADSHDMTRFRSILPMCVSPFVIASTKYRSWREIPRDAALTIGNSGVGTTTHLVSIQIARNYPNMVIVPFKSTSEALLGVLSGAVDLSVGFYGDSEEYRQPGSTRWVHWLGQTGRDAIKGSELLANQGFSRDLLDMSTPQQIFAARAMNEERFRDLRTILQRAAQAPAVLAGQAADTCTPNSLMPDSQLTAWFDQQTAQWRRLTTGVRVDK